MHKLENLRAREIWLHCQKLNTAKAFGSGSAAVEKAVRHLGYVQIDTIHVIERAHHHILYTRIPDYKPRHLEIAQSQNKSVFEYWTHALAYVPTQDYTYFVSRMHEAKKNPSSWFHSVSQDDYKKVKQLLKAGPLSIRDIQDDDLKDKRHAWDSRKPSKRALQMGFNIGEFVIAKREGMLKVYDLAARHFNWQQKPAPASPTARIEYLIERALRSQGLVNLNSICYLNNRDKAMVAKVLEQKVKKQLLVAVTVKGHEKTTYWARPELLELKPKPCTKTHILSPFDPLVIQRKRLKCFFDYEHIFEAYVPAAKRRYGYFTLPVLHENNFVALLDLKTNREKGELQIKSWHWIKPFKSRSIEQSIKDELGRFEKFQLGRSS